MAGKWTQERFLERAHEVWGDRWDYSGTTYINSKQKIELKCRAHGVFKQSPYEHLEKRVACKGCFGISYSTDSFVGKAEDVWGGRWDYTQTLYKDSKSTVTILCKSHGPFRQTPNHHLRGVVGCKGCDPRRISPEDFLQRSREVWGDRWDYSKVEFVRVLDNVTIICPLHGDFKQTPKSHMNEGLECPGCSKRTHDGFLRRASAVWGDRWDYSSTQYVGANSNISIQCRAHGVFTQRAEKHLRGNVGCRSCQINKTSPAEYEVRDFIKLLGHTVEEGRRDLLGTTHEIDIYLPENKIAFEFNGVYYHSEKFKDPAYHYNKWKMAADKGISLFQVWEDDWNFRRPIVERHIKQVLGKSDLPRVYARKLSTVEVSTHEARDFLELNHIQGFASGTVYVGGFYKEELVALAAFRKSGEDYTLVRYATSAHVVGGHSKLVSYFERNYSYVDLITFADLTFGSGNLYRKTGWIEDKLLPPDYSYLVRGERKHKFGYRLKRFRDDPELVFEEGKTERELAQMNKLLRVYDAGKIRFIKPHPKN